MKRLLPYPLLSSGMLAMWLLLNEPFTPGNLLLGLLVALGLPRLVASLRPPAGPMQRPLVLIRLILRVGAAVIRSAIEVARGVFRARRHAPRGRFVQVPLELRDEHALAALLMITAVIPGTVWSELAPDRSALLLHVFDLDDEAEFITSFKALYEHPLKEIFE